MKRPLKRFTTRWMIAIIAIPLCVIWVFFWLVAGPNLMETIRRAIWTAR